MTKATIIDGISKAIWNSTSDEFNKWDNLGEDEKEEARKAAVAALLALAEMELPDDILDTSGVIRTSQSGHYQDRHNFSCICRAILREDDDEDQAPDTLPSLS